MSAIQMFLAKVGLTCEAEEQGEVGVLSLGSLGQNAAQQAQVTEAGTNLHVELLCETRPSWLQGRGGLVRVPLLWMAHLLLEGQVLLHQFLVLG